MPLADLSHSWLSLLASIVAIAMVVLTRRVVLSLAAGVLTGILLLTHFSIPDAAGYFFHEFSSIFWLWEQHSVNTEKVYILIFLLLLGSLYSLINFSGGTVAFGDWMAKRVNSSAKAQLFTVFLGLLLFIDDYFNALAVGSTCRPMTDKQKVSRAKLAYILDSTSAPVCVLMPLSSWGAYIISLLGAFMAAHGLSEAVYGSPFTMFLTMIPLNLYAILSLGMVIAVACLKLDIFSMATHEKNAKNGSLYDKEKGYPPGSHQEEPAYHGHILDLLLPIGVLTFTTILTMVLSGVNALADQHLPFGFISAFEHTNVSLSLVNGSIAGMLTSLIMLVPRRPGLGKLIKTIYLGFKAMIGAIIILLIAWLLVNVISQLGVGIYLSGFILGILDAHYIPALLFLVACMIAFATGSSWGTFGIMIPIAANLAINIHDPVLFVPIISTVIAGSVFGDHCSPISDTTVLSSIGAGCHHIDHVMTQWPYSLIAAVISFIGYLVMGLTASPATGIWTALAVFILFVSAIHAVKAIKK